MSKIGLIQLQGIGAVKALRDEDQMTLVFLMSRISQCLTDAHRTRK